MEVIREADAFHAAMEAAREGGASIGFVPTMGALHEGHSSLIRRARADNDVAAISIFVNPFQFGPGEDLERYPRDEPADLAMAERLGVDAAWAPPPEQMYPPGWSVPSEAVDPGPIGAVLEGASRGVEHFRGVLTAVFRLLEVAGACRAYFGEKDAQQLFLVRRMVRERALPVGIVACQAVREPDGLACSSRNAYLGPEERDAAGCLFLALSEAAERVRAGERDAAVLVAVMAREIGGTPLALLDYAAVVEEETFEQVRTLERPARALVAARIGTTRLIDNLRLPDPA